jgi:hypothetical protein
MSPDIRPPRPLEPEGIGGYGVDLAEGGPAPKPPAKAFPRG